MRRLGLHRVPYLKKHQDTSIIQSTRGLGHAAPARERRNGLAVIGKNSLGETIRRTRREERGFERPNR
jgi:hypothetical protein